MSWIGCGGGHRAAAAVRLMLACLAVSACQAERLGTSTAALRAAWSGARYPPPPPDVVIVRGTTLGTADTARFAIADVTARGERLLWLARRSGDVAGQATWTVVDVLAVPGPAAGRRLILAVCGAPRHAGSPPADPGEVVLDPEIVAVARGGDEAVLADVVTAWRANRAAGRFEPMPTAGVACLNDEADV